MTAFTFRDLAFLAQQRYPNFVEEYLRRVNEADAAAGSTQGLERPVTDAISVCLQALVVDGILGVTGASPEVQVLSASASLIKASCLMMGARTLSGALVPLAADMPAPTSFNFVAGDYNRRTGLGDPVNTTKRLNSNYVIPGGFQDDCSMAAFFSENDTTGAAMGYVDSGENGSFLSSRNARLYNAGTSTFAPSNTTATGFRGVSRASSASFIYRHTGSNETASISSTAVTHEAISVFARSRPSGGVDSFSNARLNFYSIGAFLNLDPLEARITALSNAIQAAIAP